MSGLRYCKILLGNLLITSAYAFITVPHEILNGGTTSFAMVLSRITGWGVSWIVNGIILCLLIACRLFLGRPYTVGAIFSAVSYSVLFSFLDALQWSLPLPDIICIPLAAIMVGSGYALCILAKSTALGFDTVALILHKKYERLSISWLMFGINLAVLLAGVATYGWKAIACGIIFTFIQTRMLNILLRMQEKQSCETSVS